MRTKTFLYLGSSMTLVGLYVALAKPLVASIPVTLLALLRFAIAALYMLPWLKAAQDEVPISTRTHRLLCVESFLGNFLFSICMLYGVSLSGAGAAGVTFASIPMVVALLGSIFLREKLSPTLLASIALCVFGIALLAWDRYGLAAHDAQGHSIIGLALLIGAVFCEASYVVIGKSLTGNLSPRRISAIVNLWGLVFTLPFGLHEACYFDFSSLALWHWALLAFYALAASAWSVQLWMAGLRHTPASHAGVMTVMLPISTSLVAWFALDERFGMIQLLALCLAIAGVLIATVAPARGVHI